MNFVIKTKFNNSVKFVTISEDDSRNFVAYTNKGKRRLFSRSQKNCVFIFPSLKFEALEAFGIDAKELEGVYMWDRDGADISMDNFASVVHQFRHSNSFLIRLAISSEATSSLLTQVYRLFL